MNLILKSRGTELSDRLRSYATDKFTKVERFFDRIIKMEVELSEERNPRVKDAYKVDVTVKTPRDTLRASGAGGDHYTAIDQAADRLEQQVKKFKDRLIDRSQRKGPPSEPVDTSEGDAEQARPIVRMPMQVAKPLTPEEAALELEDRGLAFLLFTNAETLSPCVLYRRNDLAYGLIEHEG